MEPSQSPESQNYAITSGNGSKWVKGFKMNFTIGSNIDFGKFVRVEVEGETLEPSNDRVLLIMIARFPTNRTVTLGNKASDTSGYTIASLSTGTCSVKKISVRYGE